MDYQSNSNKSKQPKPDKQIERVINTEVLVQKKTLGQKVKDLFIQADVGSVARFVIYEVIIPAARNTIVDASSKGIERMMFGDRAMQRRNIGGGYGVGYGYGQRVTYNSPVNRAGAMSSMRPPGPSRPMMQKSPRDNLIFTSQEEAMLVLERMNDIIDSYQVVTVADLNDLVGLPTSYTDNNWGWAFLGGVQIRQIREGFLIDLPAAEPIQ